MKTVCIAGYEHETVNYKNAVESYGASAFISLETSSSFDLLLLPGGGDIHPSFFNKPNEGSEDIDIALDRLQFSMLQKAIIENKPVLGICKGMQLINVYFGGGICQNLSQELCEIHAYDKDDKQHPIYPIFSSCQTKEECPFVNQLFHNPLVAPLLQNTILVNSAHHQSVTHLGYGLTILQYAKPFIPESIAHECLPILGLQWHPERYYNGSQNMLHPFLDFFLS